MLKGATCTHGYVSLENPFKIGLSNMFFFDFSVTVARAVELKHKASLISALTYETSKLFTEAGMVISLLRSELPLKLALALNFFR